MSEAKKANIARRLGVIGRVRVGGDDLRGKRALAPSLAKYEPKLPKPGECAALDEYRATTVAHVWKTLPGINGPPRRFTPETLLEAAEKYFQWVKDNPLKEKKQTHYQGAIVDLENPKMRAMSIRALCLFVRLTPQSWYIYCKLEEFVDVTEGIAALISNQKFEGAAGDLLNSMIISRDLGLAEKTDITSGGESITQITRTIIDNAQS